MVSSNLNDTDKISEDVKTHADHYEEQFQMAYDLYCEYLETKDEKLCRRASVKLSYAAIAIRSMVEITYRHFDFQKHQDIHGRPHDKENERDTRYQVPNYFSSKEFFDSEYKEWLVKYEDVVNSFRECTRLNNDMRYVINTANFSKHVSLDVVEKIEPIFKGIDSEDIVLADGHIVLTPDSKDMKVGLRDNDTEIESFRTPDFRFHKVKPEIDIKWKKIRLSPQTAFFCWRFPNGEIEDTFYGINMYIEEDGKASVLPVEQTNSYNIENGVEIPITSFPEQPSYEGDFGIFFHDNKMIIPKVEINSITYNPFKSVWNSCKLAEQFVNLAFHYL